MPAPDWDELPELVDEEVLVDPESDDVLMRVITLRCYDAESGEVQSCAFQDDSRQISVSQSRDASPSEALEHYAVSGPDGVRSPVGIWGVTPRECASLSCRVVDDSARPMPQAPAHAYIDLRHVASKSKTQSRERKRITDHLANFANQRGQIRD